MVILEKHIHSSDVTGLGYSEVIRYHCNNDEPFDFITAY
jgi:hypothetical protein